SQEFPRPNLRRMHALLKNPFARQAGHRGVLEAWTFWIIRAGTYLVLFAAASIFVYITIKGGAVVFKTTPPFVNVPFLTESPETLYVFDFDGKKMEMGDTEFRAFKIAHHLDDIAATSYAHSAGGIFPCIAGTVLLVAGSMV